MNYEKQFELLKEEIKELEEGKVKNSLTRLENILACLHNEFVVRREEKVRIRIDEHINHSVAGSAIPLQKLNDRIAQLEQELKDLT